LLRGGLEPLQPPPGCVFDQISQIKYSNLETELNVMKNVNKIIKSKSKSG